MRNMIELSKASCSAIGSARVEAVKEREIERESKDTFEEYVLSLV
jgi:hypothetical protein